MTKIFFTSDTHFASDRTLTLSKRPFSSTKEMDNKIINNWNKLINNDNIIYHLGDFGDEHIIKYLNGNIKLLPGNYDNDMIDKLSSNCEIIKDGQILNFDFAKNINFKLVHKPLITEHVCKKLFFLFGHIHKLQMAKRNGLNVGVDCHNFSPIDLDVISFYYNAIINHYDENVFTRYVGQVYV